MEITPRRRAAIVTLRQASNISFRNISTLLNIPKSTCNNIYRHAVKNVQAKHSAAGLGYSPASDALLLPPPVDYPANYDTIEVPQGLLNLNTAAPEPEELLLLALLDTECLDANKRTGRPKRLLPEEKERLIQFVHKSWETRRMSIVDIQQRTGLGHACRSTIHNALAEAGIKAYVEEFKFILDEDNMLAQYVCLCH